MKTHLILEYDIHVAYLVLLKASGENLENHPVIGMVFSVVFVLIVVIIFFVLVAMIKSHYCRVSPLHLAYTLKWSNTVMEIQLNIGHV